MDGYAVLAEDTFNARDDRPVELLVNEQAIPINTGTPMPEGRNAVVMIENVLHSDRGDRIFLRSPVFPWQNVRRAGEDIVATELVFPSNHYLAPYDLGALLASGNSRVWVWKRPVLEIIPTGSELIEELDGRTIPDGKIPESNSAMLAAMAEHAGAVARVCPIVPDEYESIRQKVQKVIESECHCVIVNAGSSAGSMDYTAHVIEELGDLEDLGGVHDPTLDLVLRGLAQLESERHVVVHRHVGVEGVVLEDHGDVTVLGSNVVDEPIADEQLPLGDLLEARDHAQDGRLAAP
jgi:putative molybdopterin biosynthesis protein